MRKYISITIFLFLLSNLFSSDNNEINNIIEKNINEWNNIELQSNLKIVNDQSDDYLKQSLLGKIYFNLGFIEITKSQKKTELAINNKPGSKGFFNLSAEYLEKAYNLNQSDPEIPFYLAYSYLIMVTSIESFMLYKDKIVKYNKILETGFPDSFYNIFFNAYFNMTFSELGGADRKKGKKYLSMLLDMYPDNPRTLNMLSEIALNNNDPDKSKEKTEKVMELYPFNLEAQYRNIFLKKLVRKSKLRDINITDSKFISKKLVKKFIKNYKNEVITLELLNKIRKDMRTLRTINDIDLEITDTSDDYADINVKVKGQNDLIFNVSGGYELVLDSSDIINSSRALTGLIPPLIFISYPNLLNSGLLSFEYISVSGIMNTASITFNAYEKIDIKIGYNAWVLPVFNYQTFKSLDKRYKTTIDFLSLSPSLTISKKIRDFNLDFSLSYSPKLYLLLLDWFDTKYQDKENFISPPFFYAEHNINFSITADYINMYDFGLIRDGFKIKLGAEWIKKTTDYEWGYKDNLNTPTNLCFRFNFFAEYSKKVNDFFYLSLGLHYQGGVNLYESSLIGVGKGSMATPFDMEPKIHGFDRNQFYADHLFALNTLYGLKVNKVFYTGFYYDIADFFERNSNTSTLTIVNTNLSNKLIMGFGHFVKISPVDLLNITFEAGIGLDVLNTRMYGPVFGLSLQKIMLITRKK